VTFSVTRVLIEKINNDNDREKIQFIIEDSGIGIEESFKDKIFKNFNQGDISTKKRFVGTGLGRSICKQLASLMNGNITYERVLYNLLKRKGYQCISAYNGKNALAILEINKVDLILYFISNSKLSSSL